MADHNLPFAPATLTSLSDQVYERLRLAIISAALKPGEKLVELDIAAQMGTSQGPVREALQRLEHDGLVERRARIGSFVTFLKMDEMREMVDIRSSVETFAIRRTAKTITNTQCDELDNLIEQMTEAATNHDIMTLAQIDMKFHQNIIIWSESETLLRVWSTMGNQIQRFVVQTHSEAYTDYVEIATRHAPIVQALRAHDGDAGVECIQHHIHLIFSHLERLRI
ncbi:MAG: GntR family transcriptional regulator [Anaerolineae bacterium]|nr:GntR family transcriptional regulator [Anaerolineae bacterium]MBN8618394.1 GntR family transcriptional regulator [Anaerolineae bacterium]